MSTPSTEHHHLLQRKNSIHIYLWCFMLLQVLTWQLSQIVLVVRLFLCLKRISPITNRSNQANQIAVPAWELYVSANQRAVRGFVLGFGNIQKVSWIITLLQHCREAFHCFTPTEIIYKWHNLYSCLLPSESSGCISLSWFPHCLFWLSCAWHPVGVDKYSFYTALGNNPVKEELNPLAVLLLE